MLLVDNGFATTCEIAIGDKEKGYIKKLYDSGLQKIIDEKQRQLDAWFALKNK